MRRRIYRKAHRTLKPPISKQHKAKTKNHKNLPICYAALNSGLHFPLIYAATPQLSLFLSAVSLPRSPPPWPPIITPKTNPTSTKSSPSASSSFNPSKPNSSPNASLSPPIPSSTSLQKNPNPNPRIFHTHSILIWIFFFFFWRITLPDGTVKEGKKWVTSPLDVARDISKSLAANALISEVNGVLWDMSRPLESDCELKLFTFESDEGRDTFWHSSAHILGQVWPLHCRFFAFGFFSEAKVWMFGLILDAVAWARVWVQVVYWTLYYKGRGKFFAMIFVNQNVVLESFGYCCFCRCGEKCCGFLVF